MVLPWYFREARMPKKRPGWMVLDWAPFFRVPVMVAWDSVENRIFSGSKRDGSRSSGSILEIFESLLGGELPTNRLGGLVHPSFFTGRLAPHLSHWNHQGQLTHLRFVGWTTKYLSLWKAMFQRWYAIAYIIIYHKRSRWPNKWYAMVLAMACQDTSRYRKDSFETRVWILFVVSSSRRTSSANFSRWLLHPRIGWNIRTQLGRWAPWLKNHVTKPLGILFVDLPTQRRLAFWNRLKLDGRHETNICNCLGFSTCFGCEAR